MTDSPRADPFQFPGDAPPSTAAFPPPHAPFGFHTSGPSFGNGPHALGPRFGDGFPARGPLVPGAQFSPGPSHFQPQPGAGPFAPHAHPHAPPGPFQPFAAPQPQWASAPSPFTGPPPSDHGSASSSVDSHFESRGKAQFESRGPILRFGPREPRRSSRDDDKLTRRSRTREPVAPPDYADPDDMPLPPVPVRSRTPDPVRASHPAGDGYRPRDSGGLVIYGGTSANKTVLKVVQKPPSEKDKNKKGGFMGTITKFFGIGNSDSSPSQLMPAKPPRPSQPSPSPPSPMSPPPPPPPVPAVPLDASTRQHTPPSAKSAASSRTSRSSNPPQSFSKRVEAMAANLTDVLDGRVEQIDQKARQFDQAMQHFDSTGDTTPVREALEPVVRALKALSPSTAAAAADPAADATGSASSASRSVSSDSSESDEDFEDLEIDEGGMDPERVAAHKARIKELNDGMRKAKRDARTIKRESRKHSLDERERSRVAKQEATLRDREAQLEARLWQRKQQLEAQLRQRDAAHQQSAAHAAQAAAMAAHGAAGISEIHSAAIAEQHAAAMAEQGVAMAAMTSAAAAEGYDRARNMSVDSSGDSFEPLPPLFPTVARPRVLPPSQARETVVDFFPNVPESDMSPNDLNPDLLRVTVGLKLELLDTTLADYEHGYMRASYRGSDSGISGLVPLQALRANHVEVQSPFTDGHRVLQTHPAPIIAHTLGTGDGPEADSPIFIVATDLSIQRLDLPATTLNEDGSIFVPSRTMSIMSQTLHVKVFFSFYFFTFLFV
ncbi:hypothetical protein BC828DRAFT_141814 [Blastocladiella britannica]|nr:hypothetical protein BC828DRAFT_141814 [Blastocladiella britannica]